MRNYKKTIFIIILSLFLLLNGCGGKRNYNTMFSISVINGEILSVPLYITNAYQEPEFIYYNCSKSLSDTKKIIDRLSNGHTLISSNLISNKYLLIEKIKDSKLDYYMIIDTAKEAESDTKEYCFFNLAGKIDWSNKSFLIPYHLFNDDIRTNLKSYHYDNGFDVEKQYEITGTKEDFYNFYNKIDVLNVTQNEDKIFIKVKEDAETIKKFAKYDFFISFYETDSKNFISFTVDN